MTAGDFYRLTARELTVLGLIAQGLPDKIIAAKLGLSVLTIRKHVSNILKKLGASSRTGAATKALKERLIE